jgi:hypothetical protein
MAPTLGQMLNGMFWKSLKPELKSITHYKREKYKAFEWTLSWHERNWNANRLDEDSSKK